MIFIALLGKSLIYHLQFLKKHLRSIRKVLGAIIILFALFTGFLNIAAPWTGMIKAATIKSDSTNQNMQLIDATMPYPAPALNSKGPWLNSPPLTMQELKGKVVLIDFWTYSCINCIRTLPYLHDWYKRYHDKGLVIIGVHAPEFAFEKNIDNVKAAVKQYDIRYPVVLDNDYIIWQNYNNSYWPAHYLIDKNGDVVYQHFGEGNYQDTEHNIRLLLGLSANATISSSTYTLTSLTQTPETYLGSERASRYAGIPALSAQNTQYNFPETLSLDQWALKGGWEIHSHYIQATAANAGIKLHFNARNVYMVMGSADHQFIKMRIKLNGKLVKNNSSSDNIIVMDDKLYHVISLSESSEGELEVQFDKPGVQVYTFTFG
jgi:thiol-disulfide isomerase/thioredoxin